MTQPLIFPPHKCGLSLTHNEHRNLYETAAEWIDSNCADQFADAEAKQRAIDTDEIWTLQWYDETPVGFFKVAAPTLGELLAFAESVR